jgi:hypothetical protein
VSRSVAKRFLGYSSQLNFRADVTGREAHDKPLTPLALYPALAEHGALVRLWPFAQLAGRVLTADVMVMW